MMKTLTACLLALASGVYGEITVRALPVKVSAPEDYWVRGVYMVLDDVSVPLSCSADGSMTAYVDNFYGSGRFVTPENSAESMRLVGSAIKNRRHIYLTGGCNGEVFKIRKIRGSGTVDFSR